MMYRETNIFYDNKNPRRHLHETNSDIVSHVDNVKRVNFPLAQRIMGHCPHPHSQIPSAYDEYFSLQKKIMKN